MKNAVLIALIMAMLCLLAVGCKKGMEDTPIIYNTPTPSTSRTNVGSNLNEGNLNGSNLNEGNLNEGNPDGLVWVVDSTAFAGYIQEDVNRLLKEKGRTYTVKIIAIDPWKMDYMVELKNLMENGQQVDIAYIAGFEGQDNYYDLVRNGMAESLDTYLQSEAGRPLKDAIEPKRWEMLKVDGHIFGVSNYFINTSIGYVYNKSLLEKHNIDPKTLKADIFQNEEAIQKIFEEDRAPIALWAVNEKLLGYAFLSDSPLIGYSFDDREGKAVSVFEQPDVREFLWRMKHFKDNGYIVSLNIEGFDIVGRENGYSALLYYSSLPALSEVTISEFLDREGNQIITDTLFVPQGADRVNALYTPTCVSAAIPSWSQKKEDALDFLTLLFADPDVANLVAYGVEQRDYTLDDKSRITDRLKSKGSDLFAVQGEWYTNGVITYPRDEQPNNKKELVEKAIHETTLPALAGFHFDSTPVQAELDAVNTLFYMSEEYGPQRYTSEVAALLSGKVDDVDSALSAFQEKLKAAGIDRVVEEANRQIAVWKEKL